MIIENSDALKCWLTSCLGRLCHADPAALAKYVLALVKKDKPESELKEFCVDQLDVFLVNETKSFVELLFETLKSKAYLHSNVVPPPPGNIVTLTTNEVYNPILTPLATATSSVINPAPAGDNYPLPGAVKNDKDKKVEEISKINTNIVLPGRETKRFPRRSRSSSKSHSGSPCEKFPRHRSPSRESDGRRRRRSEEERRHRNYSRRRDNRTYRNRRGDQSDRDHAVREKDLRRTSNTHNVDEKQRSRSRSRSRSTSYDRNRSRSRTCSSSSTEYSRSRSVSRSRDRSDRPKDHSSRSDSRNSRKKAETPQLSLDHGDTDYRLGSSVTNVTSVCRTSDGSKTKVGGRKRCQDYDEKGYCMRGDQCPYDHGNDPLVVEDVSVLNFNVPVSQASNSTCVMPPLMLPKPPGVESPIPPLPPSSPPKPPPPPPPPPSLPAPSSFAPEPYNPEAPAIFRAKTDQIPFWSPSSPPPLHPPVPPCAPPPGQPPILPSRIVGVPAFNPNEPPPSFHSQPKVKRTRELIGVPTLDGAEPIDSTSPSENVSASSSQQMASLKKGQTNTTNVTNTIPSVGPVPDENFFKRKTFDYSRLGTRKPIKKNIDRCVLELRKVPKYLNNVTNLSNHFSQFGHITSILTHIDNDPEAALVCFSTHAEATLAYRNKEAVLHNRFIKVFWHNKDVGSSVQSSLETVSTTVSTSNDLPPSLNDQLRKDNVTDVTSTTPVISNENKPIKMEPISKRAVVVSNKGGNLSRTVFNPAALKKNNIISPVLLPNKKHKDEERKEALKKKLDLHKKKQSILQKYIDNEKMLIEKLAVCKSDNRDSFKQTIEDIRLKILSLKSDMKKEGDEIKKLMKSCNGAHSNKTAAEKELLDAEMDLYNRQYKGDDVSDLLSKVVELKQQTCNLFAEMGRGRGLRSGRRLALRFRGSRGRSAHMSRCVDHRPRKILVSNSAGIDKEKLRNHFLKFGDVESIDVTDHGLVVSWKSRQEAEIAFSLGSKFNDTILLLSWFPNSTNIGHSLKPENFNSLTERNRGLFEEEEEEEEDEEDSEARSWRR